MKLVWFVFGLVVILGGYFAFPYMDKAMQQAGSSIEEMAEPLTEDKKLYKWKDAQGKWHFSDIAPNQGEQYQDVAMPKVKNTMPEQLIVETEDEKPDASGPSINKVGKTPVELLKNAHKTMEDAKNVEKLLQQRDEQVRNL